MFNEEKVLGFTHKLSELKNDNHFDVTFKDQNDAEDNQNAAKKRHQGGRSLSRIKA